MQWTMVYALTDYVDDAALADFGGKSREKLLTVDVLAVLVIDNAELLEVLRLGNAQELEQLRHIDRVCAIVILGIASEPTVTGRQGHFRDDAINAESEPVGAGHVPGDQRFEALLRRVGCGHALSFNCLKCGRSAFSKRSMSLMMASCRMGHWSSGER